MNNNTSDLLTLIINNENDIINEINNNIYSTEYLLNIEIIKNKELKTLIEQLKQDIYLFDKKIENLNSLSNTLKNNK